MLPDSYIPELTPQLIRTYLPFLQRGVNFTFESRSSDDYNCVSWAINRDDENIFLYLPNGTIDLRLNSYIEYYKSIGFEEADNIEPEPGITKIALYAFEDEFQHVARQLEDGRWASKLGEWEDIEHNTLDVLSGNFYGNPVVFLERIIAQ